MKQSDIPERNLLGIQRGIEAILLSAALRAAAQAQQLAASTVIQFAREMQQMASIPQAREAARWMEATRMERLGLAKLGSETLLMFSKVSALPETSRFAAAMANSTNLGSAVLAMRENFSTQFGSWVPDTLFGLSALRGQISERFSTLHADEQAVWGLRFPPSMRRRPTCKQVTRFVRPEAKEYLPSCS